MRLSVPFEVHERASPDAFAHLTCPQESSFFASARSEQACRYQKAPGGEAPTEVTGCREAVYGEVRPLTDLFSGLLCSRRRCRCLFCRPLPPVFCMQQNDTEREWKGMHARLRA